MKIKLSSEPLPLPGYKLISYKKWKNKLLPEGAKCWYCGQWESVPFPSTYLNEKSIVSIPGNDVETITIKTHCPEKWLLIDRETGECWKWDDGKLVKA